MMNTTNAPNTGPWVVRSTSHGAQLEHADARHDAVLHLVGRFDTSAQALAFAQQLADTLNGNYRAGAR